MSAPDLGFIHRFVPAADPAAPVLLLLHGTGGDENDLLDLGRTVAPGWTLLSPRGQVLEHGMPRFFRRLAEGVFDQDDLRARTDALADFIAAAAAHYGFDPARVTALGFSNGANIAASMLLRRPQALAGALLLHALVPFTPASPPNLAGRPIFLAAGRTDPIASPAQTAALAALLRQAGADVTLFQHDGGHQITPGEVRAARDWLRQHDFRTS